MFHVHCTKCVWCVTANITVPMDTQDTMSPLHHHSAEREMKKKNMLNGHGGGQHLNYSQKNHEEKMTHPQTRNACGRLYTIANFSKLCLSSHNELRNMVYMGLYQWQDARNEMYVLTAVNPEFWLSVWLCQAKTKPSMILAKLAISDR